MRTQRRVARLGLSGRTRLSASLRLCCSTRRALALRCGAGPILLLRLLSLRRLRARLPLGLSTRLALALCSGTGRALTLCRGAALLLWLLTLTGLSAAGCSLPPTFGLARLFAVAPTLSYGLVLLALVFLHLAAVALLSPIDLSLGLLFAPSAFSRRLSCSLAPHFLSVRSLTAVDRPLALAFSATAFSHPTLASRLALHSFAMRSPR